MKATVSTLPYFTLRFMIIHENRSKVEENISEERNENN